MKEYPDDLTREFWLEVAKMIITLAGIAAVFVAVHYATRITPEREAALRAEGAAAFDAKVERAGGWQKWLAAEINVGARRAGNVSAAPRGEEEVR